MFRRRTRNSTAYTGVSPFETYGQKPSNNAQAAALSIGKNLRKSDPATYGPQQTQPVLSPPTQRSGSLLKRSPSLQNSSFRATSTPRDSRQGSRSGSLLRSQQHHNQHVYNIDDSFTNSTFEEIGHETDAVYNNRQQLNDLQLRHTPSQPPPVKMVKKYIPTPNGVQVVEVPESSMEKAIARSNSMRTGLSIGNYNKGSRPGSRAGLLTGSRTNSLSRGPQRPASRSSSLNARSARPRPQHDTAASLASFRIDENVELEKDDSGHMNHDILRELERERQLALDLEAKRKEYEQLKELRLQNEKKMAELRRLEEELSSHESTLSPTPPAATAASHEEPVPVSEGALSQSSPAKSEETSDEEVPVQPVPFAVDEFEKRKLSAGEDELAAAQHKFTGSNLDLNSETTANPSYDDVSISRAVTANDVLNTYAALGEPDVAEAKKDNDFGIVEVPDDEDEKTPNLAQQLKPKFDHEDVTLDGPKFDPVPEIIKDDINPPETLTPPAGTNASIRSGSSTDSRPIKSAMKNSKSNYTLNSNSNTNHNPAQQAYLSLTTAENTRLNSKLSSGQLVDQNGQLLFTEVKQGPPKSPNNQLKLAAATLRKQPSLGQPPSLADRSLRPRTHSDASSRHNESMSNRSFQQHKQQPQHFQPQPIPQHPLSQANYQSPGKAKAAELYAKANNKPLSTGGVFRRSSYSKAAPEPRPEDQQGAAPKHRFSLRPQSPPAPNGPTKGGFNSANAVGSSRTLRNGGLHIQPGSQAQASQPKASGGFGGFRSRFADSDDEDGPSGGFGGFKSRFNNSDDNVAAAPAASLHAPAGTPLFLREQPKQAEEKPKKKKFLRKLFGRNKKD